MSPSPAPAWTPFNPASPPVRGSLPASEPTAWLMSAALLLLLVGSGCLVVPIPSNRADPAARRNVSAGSGSALAVGQTTREQVLLKLGEPDEVSADEHRYRYHTERVMWDVIVIAAGSTTAAGGDIEVRKQADLIVEFDDHGIVSECRWVTGYNPQKLQEQGRWVVTNAPPANPSPAGGFKP